MEKMKWEPAPKDLIDQFLNTMQEITEAEKRKMFGYPCCFYNGLMFTGLFKSHWILRLSDEDRKVIVDKHQAIPFEPWPGRAMKEYVMLPSTIINNPKELLKWLQHSLNFVKILPPKKPKPKKKKALI